MNKIKVLELFAGSRSIGKVADELGYEVFSSDIFPFDKVDYVEDILSFDVSKVPFKPDVLWASPPCTTYSIAAISKHRPKVGEISEFSKVSDQIMHKLFEIIRELQPRFWYIENPRAMLRKQPFMANIPRTTVWYCQYGDENAKPTDIWSNNLKSLTNLDGWDPRPECFNGNPDCHHASAPRGSLTGIQKTRKRSYDRSKIPAQLCMEILTTNNLK